MFVYDRPQPFQKHINRMFIDAEYRSVLFLKQYLNPDNIET